MPSPTREPLPLTLSYLWCLNCREQVIPCEELEQALTRLKETSGEAKVRSLVSVLDPDHDGNINIREIAEVSICFEQETNK